MDLPLLWLSNSTGSSYILITRMGSIMENGLWWNEDLKMLSIVARMLNAYIYLW